MLSYDQITRIAKQYYAPDSLGFSAAPRVGDRIYADGEEFITVVREIKDTYLITAGWPACSFEIAKCKFVERGML